MQLIDDSIKYAFSGKRYTNIGKEDNVLYKSSDLSIAFEGLQNSKDFAGVKIIVLLLDVSNKRSKKIWVCYSQIKNNDEDYCDDFVVIEANQDRQISIVVDNFDFADTVSRKVKINLVIEDERGKIIERCNSVFVEYNVFSGRYYYENHKVSNSGKNSNYRELNIKVNRPYKKIFYDIEESYKTISVIISNCSDCNKALEIKLLEFNGEKIFDTDVKGISSLNDVVYLKARDSLELIIDLTYVDIWGGESFLLNFLDIATNRLYVNEYSYNIFSHKFEMDNNLVFIHDDFEIE